MIEQVLSPLSLRRSLRSLTPEKIEAIKSELDDNTAALAHEQMSWVINARDDQVLPDGAWTYWLILAGRGWGKTRTGAETVRWWARSNAFVNLIGATRDDARDIMIEGESGIMACCPRDERPIYRKHESKLTWPNGCVSLVFTADEPERLRGKQHEKLWCDEMAAWRRPEAWDQAKFGLRLGANPQAVITTTPRPVPNVRELIQDDACHVTRGTTYDNRDNLAPSFFAEIIKRYEGTRLGRQELEAEILDDMPGALWRRALLEEHRIHHTDAPDMKRIVVSVDPAISTTEKSDETGIVVVGLGMDGRGYVLEDASGVYQPDEWGRQVSALVARYNADAVVYERNQGGDMVAHVIKSVMPRCRLIGVTASKGKVTRAEPTSALYEQGRVSHVGRHDDLEDQMCAFTIDFDRKSMGYSPDRVDALVWGFEELFPRVIRPKAPRRPSVQPKW